MKIADCLFNEKIIFKNQQRFKSYYHDVYAEEINKVVLNSDDDKSIQTFNLHHLHKKHPLLKFVKMKC